MTNRLDLVSQRIQELESTESVMIEKLQRSMNENNRILSATRFLSPHKRPAIFSEKDVQLTQSSEWN